MERVIDIKNLQKSFNNHTVLNDVTLCLHQKENIVILGKSGSGKSVLMKIIVRLIEPEKGKVIVLGNDVAHLKETEMIELRRKVGYVFQEGALYDSMTVGENISFSLKRQLKKIKREEVKSKVHSVLKSVGLLDAINKMPDELSGGMKKRIALARTLVLEPSIILYDEPTAGLDPVTSKEIIHLIQNMKINMGISSIIATHDLICTKMTADRVLILHEGKIDAEGSYEELEQSNKEHIRAFFI
jgi:phospholipid/cholesterol/gamma-HCH transport system ATP-binding protein